MFLFPRTGTRTHPSVNASAIVVGLEFREEIQLFNNARFIHRRKHLPDFPRLFLAVQVTLLDSVGRGWFSEIPVAEEVSDKLVVRGVEPETYWWEFVLHYLVLVVAVADVDLLLLAGHCRHSDSH